MKEDSPDILKSNNSKVELSSFFDCSEVRNAEYDPIFPRKHESSVVQSFKKKMLETAIKPKSWKD